MTATRNGAHDPRCEWSRTPPKRCRCACQGVQHGTERVRKALLALETLVERDKNEMEHQ